ncbi:zinc ribbon domain-containing protein [Brevibacterium otitidis]|uniref:Zinc ribbon domain-containing protein n=1 Tax=Brevibacterium otitidis TaxID=53364 RepID=A0ABV5WY62_9MICO|nr:zinc ribbon domain-containing protein [Brevibacterium otitidis]
MTAKTTTLSTEEQQALSDWIDTAAQSRRTEHEAQQTELIARLRQLAGEHQATAAMRRELEATLEAYRRQAEEIDADVEARSNRVEQMRDALNSGEGLTSRDLLALQSDIDTAIAAKGERENDQLELMSEIDDLTERISTVTEDLNRIGATGKQLQQQRSERGAELSAAAEQLAAERKQIATRLPEAIGARLLQAFGAGQATAALVAAGACGACGSQLSGMILDRLSSPGATADCEECGALLLKA